MELTRGFLAEPQRIVLYGPEGIGKTRLASQMPNPVFIDVEGSTSDIDVARTPKPSSWRALCDQVTEFTRDHHGHQTLVIDTADWAEKMCIAHVCAANNYTSLGGQDDYGKSYNILEQEWCRFLDLLSRVASSGMHVCLTAHAGVKTVRQPDLDNSYERWELKMEKKTSAATKEWARTVLFLNYKTYVIEEKGGKTRGTGGHRVMYSTHTPAWDAKNRAGLPEEMRLEYSAIAGLFLPKHVEPTPAQPTIEPAPQPDQQIPEPPTFMPQPYDRPAFLLPLFELMKRDRITEEEVQKAVAKRGYFPADTPLEKFGEQFVAGRLVAHWQGVLGIINTIRQEAQV